MIIQGHVHQGVVVLAGNQKLPEGVEVTVICPSVPSHAEERPKRPIRLPLVPSDNPGSLHLTAERIAEILEEEDLHGLSS